MCYAVLRRVNHVEHCHCHCYSGHTSVQCILLPKTRPSCVAALTSLLPLAV